jgi:hypothetical protein
LALSELGVELMVAVEANGRTGLTCCKLYPACRSSDPGLQDRRGHLAPRARQRVSQPDSGDVAERSGLTAGGEGGDGADPRLQHAGGAGADHGDAGDHKAGQRCVGHGRRGLVDKGLLLREKPTSEFRGGDIGLKKKAPDGSGASRGAIST